MHKLVKVNGMVTNISKKHLMLESDKIYENANQTWNVESCVYLGSDTPRTIQASTAITKRCYLSEVTLDPACRTYILNDQRLGTVDNHQPDNGTRHHQPDTEHASSQRSFT